MAKSNELNRLRRHLKEVEYQISWHRASLQTMEADVKATRIKILKLEQGQMLLPVISEGEE